MAGVRLGLGLAVACSLAIGPAAATPAGAATLSTSACVSSIGSKNSRTMPISGTGFEPGARISVDYATSVAPGRTFLTAVIADASGAFSTRTVPPLFHAFSTREQTFDLFATTAADPPVEASTRFKQVLFGYETVPRASNSKRIVRHVVRGFPAGRATFLHFRHAGLTKRTVLLGRTSGPCGIVSRRMAALPVKVEIGTWTVYADQRRAFSIRTRPQAHSSFVVKSSGG